MSATGRRRADDGRRIRAISPVTVLLAGVLMLSQTQVGGAADAVVPPAVGAALTVRILDYDRSLKTWAGGSLTVGVVTKEGGSAGVAGLLQAISGQEAQGVPLKAIEHVYRDGESLSRWIDRNGVRFLWLSSDLGPEARTIVSTSAARRLPTLALTRAHFTSGATLGIVVKETKPHIMVNLAGCKAAGMDLDPKLLQLAEVIR